MVLALKYWDANRRRSGHRQTRYWPGQPCGQCGCDNTDRETQLYMPQLNNDVIWCFGTSSMEYHCSTAVLVGAAS